MTPDLQRLCASAQTASGRDDIELTPAECEAIVRAVLTALREPSIGALDAAATAIDDAHEASRDSYGEYTVTSGSDYALPGLLAMIDHILTP